jgi:predicted ATP-grasp superfamily ATP-dependent carboligase
MDLAPAVVCVDGMGTNALATLRALGRRRIPVYVVALKGSRQILSASRYCTALVEAPDEAGLCATLLRLARRLQRRPVLYIDNDAMIRLLAPHAAQLGRCFEVVEPLGDAERLTDKAFQLRAAAEAGIAVPRSWFPASWAELQAIGRETRKRLIAKPSPARLAPGVDAGFKALICASAEALAAELRGRGVAPDAVLVQEYVEGDDAQIQVGLCYRAGDGRSFLLSAKKLRQTRPGAGVMAVGQVIEAPEVREMTRRLAQALGMRGVLCTEFKLDPIDGKLYFIEWNPRPAYFQSLGWKAGFDLAWLAYCDRVDAARLPEPGAPARQSSRHYWINVRADLLHLSVVPRLALRRATWAPYLADKEWAVFARDDPKPWLRALTQLAATAPKALMRLLAVRLSRKPPVRVAH